ncbi:protein disulfide-isomerase A2 [Syngnathoides biaculeatus]|uniref:protein disulfide-isomerase A2 n=1 Tax=Syngnathoides biaculeatus TaxID=300417 RepID=UPI002ADE1B1B|nr:protein disulfide-isomerase A2 [Syngnathoides biaculeatus]
MQLAKMRTRALLVTGLVLLAFRCHAGASDEGAETQTAAGESEKEAREVGGGQHEKEKTGDIKEESDVMVLHANNFAGALNQTKFLLVEFYAPWCGHCKQLEPIFAEAAHKLKKDEAAVGLAKVDAIDEKELAEEFAIASFPTLKLFVDGNRKQPVDFTGKRTVTGIIKWLKRRSGPGASVLDTPESAAHFVDTYNIAVVGFFKSLESDAAQEFSELVMDMTDTEFGITTSPEVFQKYELKSDAVVLFKKFDSGRADFALSDDGKLDKSNLTKFIQENSLELIIPFTKETGDKIFSSSVRLHCLLFINSTVASHTALVDQVRPLAEAYKGKMLFITIDVSPAVSFVLDFFGVSAADAPTARIINMDTGKKFKVDSADLATALPPLCQQVLDGTAKHYYRTQDVPEDWDKTAVKVLVGKNFESIALDPTKNVFVEFYAPWCGHCKQLAPIWDQLGQKYAERDDIVIAKMDSTANELEAVAITGFPTLKYFPAGGKEVVEYTGKRDLETLSKFLDNGGVLPEDDDDNEDDSDNQAETGEFLEKAENTTAHKDEL